MTQGQCYGSSSPLQWVMFSFWNQGINNAYRSTTQRFSPANTTFSLHHCNTLNTGKSSPKTPQISKMITWHPPNTDIMSWTSKIYEKLRLQNTVLSAPIPILWNESNQHWIYQATYSRFTMPVAPNIKITFISDITTSAKITVTHSLQ